MKPFEKKKDMKIKTTEIEPEKMSVLELYQLLSSVSVVLKKSH